MKSLFKKLFIDNWQRKLLALILAIITWLFVNHSFSSTKTLNDLPIRITNLPKDKIIKGMQCDGLLKETISLEIQGNKNLINTITKNDLEVLIDLKDNKKEEYNTLISKNNLISKNPNIKIKRAIKKIKNEEFSLKLSNFVKEKISLLITQPLGKAPKGYQFLDVWPYRLYIKVSGPEEIIENLKAKGLSLTFNLDEISERELDIIEASKKRGRNDVVSFFVPTAWKRLNIPEISFSPMEIDDPNAKALRIDFIKKDFIPMNFPIPIILFFPTKTSEKLNPANIFLANNDYVKKINGVDMLTIPLFTKGVSELLIDMLKEKLFIIILVEPNEEKEFLNWKIQTIFPTEVEKIFIKKLFSEDAEDEIKNSFIKEEFYKVRFREQMNKVSFWTSPKQKLNLKITLDNNKIFVNPE